MVILVAAVLRYDDNSYGVSQGERRATLSTNFPYNVVTHGIILGTEKGGCLISGDETPCLVWRIFEAIGLFGGIFFQEQQRRRTQIVENTIDTQYNYRLAVNWVKNCLPRSLCPAQEIV